jgi:hypothetical protein
MTGGSFGFTLSIPIEVEPLPGDTTRRRRMPRHGMGGPMSGYAVFLGNLYGWGRMPRVAAMRRAYRAKVGGWR